MAFSSVGPVLRQRIVGLRRPRSALSAHGPSAHGDLRGSRVDRQHRRPSPDRTQERSVTTEQAGTEYRVEHDSMGEVRVPTWAKWRAQTQRAVENFPISGTPIERELIAALAAIKGAAAAVNAELGVLDQGIAEAIGRASVAVARGDWDEHFPIDVFQTGSGTSSNMNT